VETGILRPVAVVVMVELANPFWDMKFFRGLVGKMRYAEFLVYLFYFRAWHCRFLLCAGCSIYSFPMFFFVLKDLDFVVVDDTK
jgi:hypothetical protein